MLVKAFGGQRTLLDNKRLGSCMTAETYNHQHTKYHGLLMMGTPEEEIRVIYNTGSSDGCPTTVAWDDFSATVSTTKSNQALTLPTAALSATCTDHVQRRLHSKDNEQALVDVLSDFHICCQQISYNDIWVLERPWQQRMVLAEVRRCLWYGRSTLFSPQCQ